LVSWLLALEGPDGTGGGTGAVTAALGADSTIMTVLIKACSKTNFQLSFNLSVTLPIGQFLSPWLPSGQTGITQDQNQVQQM